MVLVLAFLVLITGLVLAFFSSVTTELTGANNYAGETNTKQLADSATQLVMGTISTATANPSTVAWASQPGMIRTYGGNASNNTTASSNPLADYKLYSSDNMVITKSQMGSATYDSTIYPNLDLSSIPTAAAPDWNTNPALFTDINAPSADSTGTYYYPVVDPSATPGVAGFSLNSPPGYNSSNPVTPTNNPAPMPVRWIYVLKDGTLSVPASIDATGKIASFAAPFGGPSPTPNPKTPSATNPIVGRIAYWTDDETSKVNINTAGEGSYWDTPHFNSTSPTSGTVTQATANQFLDYAYATFQPAKYEFQRYPGHPAQVALSPIFSGLLGQEMAGITPRLVWGGSKGGTVWAGGATATIDLTTAPRKALYASVDELLFNTARSQNTVAGANLTTPQLQKAKFFVTANSRAPEVNLFGKPRVAIWPIHTNLATNPASPYTTPYDRLIAFCSTIGTAPYRFYFQRGDSQSPTNDFSGIQRNQDLYAYLRAFMGSGASGVSGVPGFGGNFYTKYKDSAGNNVGEADQILTEIFDYIRCTNLSDPALGGIPLTGSWSKSTYQFANYQNAVYNPANNDELCGQVMPIQPPATATSSQSTMGFGRYHTVKDVTMVFACTGDGKDGPMPAILIPPPTIYQQSNDPDTTNPNKATYNPTLVGTALKTTEKRFQMALLLNYFLPSPGQLKCGPDMLVRISNLDQISISGATNVDGGGSLFPTPPTASGWVGKLMPSPYGGYNPVDSVQKVRFPFIMHRSPLYYRPTYASVTNGRIIYPFVSRAFTLASGNTLALASSVTLKIELFQAKSAYDGNDASLSNSLKAPGAPTYATVLADPANLMQTINVTFPAGTFPQPTLAVTSATDFIQGLPPPPAVGSPQGAWGFDGRIASPYTGGQQASAIIAHTQVTTNPVTSPSVIFDTVRTVSVASGDARMVAASSVIPASLSMYNFGNLPNSSVTYNDASGSTAASKSFHYLFDNVSPLGAQSGKLVTGSVSVSSNIPSGTDTNYCKYGDWDGPQVRTGSGAFINKPDEGDNQDLGSGGTSQIPYYGFAESTVKNLNLYTPNRLMPSAGMFGSLSTGVKRNLPWQTLLFRPQPTHPNYSTTIPDHLIMDLFWMPVVEPYAISEPFSTAGKINLNYAMAPFNYITRATAITSLLKNEKIAARPITMDQAPANTPLRLDINPSETGGTLQQFKQKFASGAIFRSATEICDLDLVPVTDSAGAAQTWSSTWGANFWNNNANTGDNLRERPYANLYARLTTKSNTYTVHFRVQTLKKAPTTNVAQWDESKDQIASEYRGSSIIERYIDANDPRLPDFATASASATLDSYPDPSNPTNNISAYKFRVVNTKRFSP